jgi:hypothetical protein
MDESKTKYTRINRSVTNVEQNLITDGQHLKGFRILDVFVKVKFTLEQATKALRGGRSTNLLFL